MTGLIPPWWAASILANVCITAIEYLNRAGGYATFREALWHTLLLIIVAQWALFYTFRDAPTLMLAWWVFAIGSSAMRICNSHFLMNEPVDWRIGAGVVLMLAGGYLVKGDS